MLSTVILLGPQRHVPIVRQAVESLGVDKRRPLAVVTAGWEEREDEDGELRDHLQRPTHNLHVWQRVERIFEEDTELLGAMRERHDKLRKVQELYRVRLGGMMESTRELFRRSGDDRRKQRQCRQCRAPPFRMGARPEDENCRRSCCGTFRYHPSNASRRGS